MSSVPIKRERDSDSDESSLSDAESRIQDDMDAKPPPSTTKPPPAKRAKKKQDLMHPFPDWPRPTPDDCRQVHALLINMHFQPRRKPRDAPSLYIEGCDGIPTFLDAIIRALLSAGTNSRNCERAFKNIIERYGPPADGDRGFVDWDAVRRGSRETLCDVIRTGGMANVKSGRVKQTLDQLFKENQQLRSALAQTTTPTDPLLLQLLQTIKGHDDTVSLTSSSRTTADYLRALPTADLMLRLTALPGVGPKTAGCVAMFWCSRDLMPVDTHILRLCKWLRWVPAHATPEQAFLHCGTCS
jgi:DNA-(apurinic or apyrimidinic site) lyase